MLNYHSIIIEIQTTNHPQKSIVLLKAEALNLGGTQVSTAEPWMEAGQNEHLQMAHKLLGLFPRETLNRQHFGLWPNKASSHTTPHSIQPPYAYTS